MLSGVLRAARLGGVAGARGGGLAGTARPLSAGARHADFHLPTAEDMAEHEQRAAPFKKRWRVTSATILERRPVIMPDLEDWEADMEALWKRRSDRGRVIDDAYFQQSGTGEDGELAFDSEEDWVKELPPGMHRGGIFVPAPRETEADREGDTKSLDRALAEELFLIVRKDREDHQWQFPQGIREKTERMVDAAKRELQEECGQSLESYYFSPAPIGHIAYALPEAEQQKHNTYGVKVFFYRAYYLGGDVELDNDEVSDYAWVTRAELGQYVSPDYGKFVDQLL